MPSPTRRPPKRVNVGIADLAKMLAEVAPEIELGWTTARLEAQEAGWPGRSNPDEPKGPAKACEHDANTCTCPVIDYADPTGENSANLGRIHDDIQAMQDHRHLINTSIKALIRISARHRPPGVPAVPACAMCNDPVESRALASGGRSYVGMELIAGIWCAREGRTPMCARCRKQHERRTA